MRMSQIINKINNKINNETIIEILKIKQQLSIPYPMKEKYNIIIPPNIFQTWHSKSLPSLMYNATVKLRRMNPKFNYYLYDDTDCREFIKKITKRMF